MKIVRVLEVGERIKMGDFSIMYGFICMEDKDYGLVTHKNYGRSGRYLEIPDELYHKEIKKFTGDPFLDMCEEMKKQK